MKKHFKILSVAFIGLLICSCSSDDNKNIKVVPPIKTKNVTVLVSQKKEIYELHNSKLEHLKTLITSYDYNESGLLTTYKEENTYADDIKPSSIQTYKLLYTEDSKISEILQGDFLLHKYTYNEVNAEYQQYFTLSYGNGKTYYEKYNYNYNNQKLATKVVVRNYEKETNELASSSTRIFSYKYVDNSQLITEALEDDMGFFNTEKITYLEGNASLNDIALDNQLKRTDILQYLTGIYKPKSYIKNIDTYYGTFEYTYKFDHNNYPIQEVYTIYNKERKLIEKKIVTTYTYATKTIIQKG